MRKTVYYATGKMGQSVEGGATGRSGQEREHTVGPEITEYTDGHPGC